MSWMSDPQAWIAFATLTALELVLGIDNVVFISILVGKLPKEQQPSAYKIGLGLAMITRILLLFSLSLIMRLTNPLFVLFGHGVSGRDIVLMLGGLFLVGKSTFEIHEKLEGEEGSRSTKVAASYASILMQIVILDIVFSLDSVITAVGMARQIQVMVAAVIISVVVMMFAAKSIGEFVHKHPTVKMLALSFLLLIGVMLLADGFGHHIPKGYVYFAMAFSLFVEMLNMRMRKAAPPVHLHEPYVAEKKA